MNHPVDLRVSEDSKHIELQLDEEIERLGRVPNSPFMLVVRE